MTLDGVSASKNAQRSQNTAISRIPLPADCVRRLQNIGQIIEGNTVKILQSMKDLLEKDASKEVDTVFLDDFIKKMQENTLLDTDAYDNLERKLAPHSLSLRHIMNNLSDDIATPLDPKQIDNAMPEFKAQVKVSQLYFLNTLMVRLVERSVEYDIIQNAGRFNEKTFSRENAMRNLKRSLPHCSEQELTHMIDMSYKRMKDSQQSSKKEKSDSGYLAGVPQLPRDISDYLYRETYALQRTYSNILDPKFIDVITKQKKGSDAKVRGQVIPETPLSQFMGTDFLCRFLAVDKAPDVMGHVSNDVATAMVDRLENIVKYAYENMPALRQLEKEHKLEDFVFSRGDYAGTDDYDAHGLLETIQDVEAGTSYAEDAKEKKDTLVKDAKEKKDAELLEVSEAAYRALLEELDGEETEEAPKKSGAKGKATSKKGKKGKGKAKAKAKQAEIIDSGVEEEKSNMPSGRENKTAEQSPTYEEKLEQAMFGAASKSDNSGAWTHIPYSQSEQRILRFTKNNTYQSRIEIPQDHDPVETASLRNVHFFSSKGGDTEDDSVLVEHIRDRHKKTLEFLQQNMTEATNIDKVESVMRDVITTVKPEDIQESKEYILPNRQGIAVNAIKLSANINIGGQAKKVTCVFSRPNNQLLGEYNGNKGRPVKAPVLVMRTLYIDGL